MDEPALVALIITAATLGFVHTITGPDHFIPFIAMAKVGRWSLRRTALITLASGVGHVLSSLLIGVLGIGLGLVLTHLEIFESARGAFAGWLLLGFGVAYGVWGLIRAIRNRPHAHIHAHDDGTVHYHKHTHQRGHVHPHGEGASRGRMTPWILFAIFVFGPCEPLIPVLMYPAAKLSIWGVFVVATVFAAVTLTTMLAIVLPCHLGLVQVSFPRIERYSHAIAGGTIALCGLAIQFGL